MSTHRPPPKTEYEAWTRLAAHARRYKLPAGVVAEFHKAARTARTRGGGKALHGGAERNPLAPAPKTQAEAWSRLVEHATRYGLPKASVDSLRARAKTVRAHKRNTHATHRAARHNPAGCSVCVAADRFLKSNPARYARLRPPNLKKNPGVVVRCDACRGHGFDPKAVGGRCPTCKGVGMLVVQRNPARYARLRPPVGARKNPDASDVALLAAGPYGRAAVVGGKVAAGAGRAAAAAGRGAGTGVKGLTLLFSDIATAVKARKNPEHEQGVATILFHALPKRLKAWGVGWYDWVDLEGNPQPGRTYRTDLWTKDEALACANTVGNNLLQAGSAKEVRILHGQKLVKTLKAARKNPKDYRFEVWTDLGQHAEATTHESAQRFAQKYGQHRSAYYKDVKTGKWYTPYGKDVPQPAGIGARKNPRGKAPAYAWYVVSEGKILAGNEYREDARDAMKDLPQAYRVMKIMAATTVKRMGIDARSWSSWGSGLHDNPGEGPPGPWRVASGPGAKWRVVRDIPSWVGPDGVTYSRTSMEELVTSSGKRVLFGSKIAAQKRAAELNRPA